MRIISLFGLFVLSGCSSQQEIATSRTVYAFSGLNKTRDDYVLDQQICNNMSQNNLYSDIYEQCLFDRGNFIYKNGYLYYNNYPPVASGYCDAYSPPCISRSTGWLVAGETSIVANDVPSAPPQPEYPSPTSVAPETPPAAAVAPNPNPPVPSPEPASAAVRFRDLVEEYQAGLFRAAHPDPSNIRYNSIVLIDQSGPTTAVISDTTNWKGSSGRDFRTVLNFEIEYDNGANINAVRIKAIDYGNPTFGAFQAFNLTKTIALSYLSGNLINEGRVLSAGMTKIVNTATTIEDFVSKWRQYMVNNNPTV